MSERSATRWEKSHIQRIIVLLVLVLVLALALMPGVAQAHASFISSTPSPGQELTSAPAIVTLEFAEPLNQELSHVTVTDPTGQKFRGTSSDRKELQALLTTHAKGIYTVEWTTISNMDGSTLRGSFEFGVGVSPDGNNVASVSVAPQWINVLVTAARNLEYLGLLLATGMLTINWLARRRPFLGWVELNPRGPLLLAFFSGLAVVLGEAYTAAGALSFGVIADYVGTGQSGVMRLLRVVAEDCAIYLATRSTGIVAAPLVVAIVALAASGHIASMPAGFWSIGIEVVYLLLVGVWAGGLLALATIRPPDGWRGPDGQRLVSRFWPVGLTALVGTVGTGITRALQELGNTETLLSPSYGQVLLVKLALILVVAPLSLVVWRQRKVPQPIAAVALAGVVGITALLVTYPLTQASPTKPVVSRQAIAQESALPRQGDLTFGGEAGEVLVGLTLRPGLPGRNTVLLYLLPLKTDDASGDVRAVLQVDGYSALLQSCGTTCRKSEIDLQGGEEIRVEVNGPRGGAATFAVPLLPAADGSELVSRVQQRMPSLKTFRQDELLGPVQPPVFTQYDLQAPDRLRIRSSSGFETVWIGDRRFMHQDGNGTWNVEKDVAPPPVPAFIWDGASIISPRIIGDAEIEGTRTEVLSFFALKGSAPMWFQLWVERDGLVRRAEVYTHGQFVTHRYYDFDDPITIEPPTE